MSGLALECAARSDVGRRANNEDALYVSPRVAAVADGVGGQAAGKIAGGWASLWPTSATRAPTCCATW
jgi:protein phosphatase